MHRHLLADLAAPSCSLRLPRLGQLPQIVLDGRRGLKPRTTDDAGAVEPPEEVVGLVLDGLASCDSFAQLLECPQPILPRLFDPTAVALVPPADALQERE